MHPPRRLALLLAGLLIATTGGYLAAGTIPGDALASPPHRPGHTQGGSPSLDILLTNDDGWDAPGIQAVYERLSRAGHDVTVVAPATNQSGTSASLEFFGTVRVTHPSNDPDVYAVASTPVTTTLFGLEAVFTEEPPDLVISGTNVGANTGFDTNWSGTIGAAVVAAGFADVPAIAVSTAVDRGHEEEAAYEETADLLARLLRDGVPQIPDGMVLSINYPLLDEGRDEPRGVRYVPTAPESAAAFDFVPAEGDQWRIVPSASPGEPSPGTDAALLQRGWVTVSVLDTDRSVRHNEAPRVHQLVKRLDRSLD